MHISSVCFGNISGLLLTFIVPNYIFKSIDDNIARTWITMGILDINPRIWVLEEEFDVFASCKCSFGSPHVRSFQYVMSLEGTHCIWKL